MASSGRFFKPRRPGLEAQRTLEDEEGSERDEAEADQMVQRQAQDR